MIPIPSFCQLAWANLTTRRSRWVLGTLLAVGSIAFGIQRWMLYSDSLPELRFDDEQNVVSRPAWWGGDRWQIRVDSEDGWCLRDSTHDSERAYVTAFAYIAALDWKTGTPLWSRAYPVDSPHLARLVVSNDLIFLLLCADSEPRCDDLRFRLLVLDAATGRRQWSDAYLLPRYSWARLTVGAGLVIVSMESESTCDAEASYVYDLRGEQVCKLNTRVNAAAPAPDGYVLLTNAGALKLDSSGRTVWKRLYCPSASGQVAGSVHALDGGDYVASWHNSNSDDGVDVVRFCGADGGFRWSSHCARLGAPIFCAVCYWDEADVNVSGTRLIVRNTAGYGELRETLRLDNGELISRRDSESERRWQEWLRLH
jgi:hypothetical protein